jgi:MOSC domain-containing protein YiiM
VGSASSEVDSSTSLWLSTLNLAGDGQADLSVHGGVDKAVYAYPSEHLAVWSAELDEELGPAPFGENLSTVGVLEHDVGIGDVWTWGQAVLQVTQPRCPCFKLSLYRGRRDMQNRLRTSGRTGWYLRMLEDGEVPASGPIKRTSQDPQEISVRDAHRATSDVHLHEPDLVEAVAGHHALADRGGHRCWLACVAELVRPLGLEPRTCGLRVRCSAN